jgi:oxygen-independent coproporphyrinogen-3 oxidase
VSLKFRDEFIAALLMELVQRKNHLQNEEISSIYIGGGTPSVLTSQHIIRIMDCISLNYSITTSPEVTIEANPDDLTIEYLEMLRKAGFNRLSIGVQSFREKDLELMRRSHNARQAIDCMVNANAKGFENINMDLIYGLPNLSLKEWEKNVLMATQQPIQHISAYHLTYEPGTIFHHWKKKGSLTEISEELSVEQFLALREITDKNLFEHYEVSNFAKEGFRSKHNSTYWKGNNYIGFGPSAHSFNGTERQWNISSLKTYIEKIRNGVRYHEKEILTPKDQYHDYLLTSLRTIEGADINYIRQKFGDPICDQLTEKAREFISIADMVYEKESLKMTASGWLKSDLIVGEFMQTNDFTLPEQQPFQ